MNIIQYLFIMFYISVKNKNYHYSLHNNNQTQMGLDERYPRQEISLEEKLISLKKNFLRYKHLQILQDKNISEHDKLKIINDITNNITLRMNIRKGLENFKEL